MAKDHVTVALTGLGSDELFAGYDRQRRMKMTQWFTRLPQYLRDDHIEQILATLPGSVRETRTFQRVERLVGRARLTEAQNYSNEIDLIRPNTRQRVLSDAMLEEQVDPVAFLERVLQQQSIDSVWDRQSYMELKTTMVDDFLNYVDRMGMAHSMELRVPFLDHELVEFATRVPFQYKLKGFTTKYVLRQVAQRLLPDRIVNRKKQPFFLPLGNWIRNDLRAAVENTLDPDKIVEQGFFSMTGVQQLLDEHFSGRADHAWPIWSLYIFQAWHDRFIESADVPTHDTVRTQL